MILDLTGIEELDAAGAEALMKMVSAVELLGARPIVTGIQPRLAGVLAAIGAGETHSAGGIRGLGGVLTLRSLSDGLKASQRTASASGGTAGG